MTTTLFMLAMLYSIKLITDEMKDYPVRDK